VPRRRENQTISHTEVHILPCVEGLPCPSTDLWAIVSASKSSEAVPMGERIRERERERERNRERERETERERERERERVCVCLCVSSLWMEDLFFMGRLV
jgi:diadenosine tetraphosphate (Ap4A) HIT family hydrolase